MTYHCPVCRKEIRNVVKRDGIEFIMTFEEVRQELRAHIDSHRDDELRGFAIRVALKELSIKN